MTVDLCLKQIGQATEISIYFSLRGLVVEQTCHQG